MLVLSASICCATMHVGRGLWRVSGNSRRAMRDGSCQSMHTKHLVVRWCLDGMSPAFPWRSTTPSNLTIRRVKFHCPPAIMCIHVQKPYKLQCLSCKGFTHTAHILIKNCLKTDMYVGVVKCHKEGPCHVQCKAKP